MPRVAGPFTAVEVANGEAEVHPCGASRAEAHGIVVGVLDELDEHVVDGESHEDLVVDIDAVQPLKAQHLFKEGADGVDVLDDDTGMRHRLHFQ